MRPLREHLGPVVRDVLLNKLVNGPWYPSRLRPRLLSLVGHDVHPQAVVLPNVFLGARTGLVMAEGSHVSYGCFLDLGAPVTFERYSGISYETMVITSTHGKGSPGSGKAYSDVIEPAPVHIGEGTWVGARCVIMPGVTIGRGCIIAAGSVVTRDCAPYGLYAGVPAVRKAELAEESADGGSPPAPVAQAAGTA
ncbi:acyltransferase [Modestobacter sp. NPDC049651]|uniref:acyltransferase n=1 Tax=unclassified Modestobacter TaxID=2643866 RepID=UPI0033FACC1C